MLSTTGALANIWAPLVLADWMTQPYTAAGERRRGPAIFIYIGRLSTLNSGASGSTASGGAAGGSGAGAGGSDATPVFNFAGTVNGATTPGPVAAALGTTAP